MTGKSADSTTLIDRAVAGDEAALERLMIMYHARLSAEIGRKLPDNVRGYITVEDVLQETYVRVFRQISTFEPRGGATFYRWVAKIAESRLFDAIKAERGGGRHRVTPPDEPSSQPVVEWLELLAVYERTPSRSAAGHEAIAHIQDALGQIKAEYREALRLRYVEGLAVAEAAARMRRSEGAVCLLCHRGLKKLAQMLGSSARFFGSHD
jgi:RNA polymerase sigma-70 factor (ECF subfamily)